MNEYWTQALSPTIEHWKALTCHQMKLFIRKENANLHSITSVYCDVFLLPFVYLITRFRVVCFEVLLLVSGQLDYHKEHMMAISLFFPSPSPPLYMLFSKSSATNTSNIVVRGNVLDESAIDGSFNNIMRKDNSLMFPLPIKTLTPLSRMNDTFFLSVLVLM